MKIPIMTDDPRVGIYGTLPRQMDLKGQNPSEKWSKGMAMKLRVIFDFLLKKVFYQGPGVETSDSYSTVCI